MAFSGRELKTTYDTNHTEVITEITTTKLLCLENIHCYLCVLSLFEWITSTFLVCLSSPTESKTKTKRFFFLISLLPENIISSILIWKICLYKQDKNVSNSLNWFDHKQSKSYYHYKNVDLARKLQYVNLLQR